MSAVPNAILPPPAAPLALVQSEPLPNTRLIAAFVKAQGECPTIPRNKTVTVTTKSGGKYSFAYAPLETIMNAIRKPLKDNGLGVQQLIVDGKVVTKLMHTSGETLLSNGTEIFRTGEPGAQAYGSSLTYARRYDLSLFLGLVADDDDDGNAADGNTVTSTTIKAQNPTYVDGAGEVRPRITPTAGAMERLSGERQSDIRDLAMSVVNKLAEGLNQAAYDEIEDIGLDADEKVALWSLLGSKQRSVLKHVGESKDAKAKPSRA